MEIDNCLVSEITIAELNYHRLEAEGESNAEQLASLRHGHCKKSEQEIAKALQSNGRKVMEMKKLIHKFDITPGDIDWEF